MSASEVTTLWRYTNLFIIIIIGVVVCLERGADCLHLADATVLFFSRPRSEGWPHHGRTFSIYPCPLSF